MTIGPSRVRACPLGRCEKLNIAPKLMNNILKVEYGYKENNKPIHLILGGWGITALFNLLEGIYG